MISLHERGVITRRDRDNRIAGCALEPGFLEWLSRLPADVIEGVKQFASVPYAHPEDVIDGYGWCRPMTEKEDRSAETHRLGRVHAYWANRLLYDHFFPDRPVPRFEPLRHVGVVSDSVVVGDSVVLLGIDWHYYIRSHPIRCIRPSGDAIVTSAVRVSTVWPPNDEAGDPLWREYGRERDWDAKGVADRLRDLSRPGGRPGVFLDANVRSPSEVPPGTEVWVDRSAAREIPPLSAVERQESGRSIPVG